MNLKSAECGVPVMVGRVRFARFQFLMSFKKFLQVMYQLADLRPDSNRKRNQPRLNCNQHSTSTRISLEDGTYPIHVIQQQTAATAVCALGMSVTLWAPKPSNKGEYDR
jgi:hypothetical protein